KEPLASHLLARKMRLPRAPGDSAGARRGARARRDGPVGPARPRSGGAFAWGAEPCVAAGGRRLCQDVPSARIRRSEGGLEQAADEAVGERAFMSGGEAMGSASHRALR